VNSRSRTSPGIVQSPRTAIALAVVILAAVALYRTQRETGEDASPYHARVRHAAEHLPLQIGSWVGEDKTVPVSAVALLRPNVLMSRSYVNAETGRQAAWLLVQCGDARDLIGHYPPVCYVNSGWVLASSQPRQWKVGNLIVDGMEYDFTTPPFRNRHGMLVMNAMVMPDGKFEPDMIAVRRAAAGLQRRSFGAGQIQVIVDPALPQSERDELFVSLVMAHRPLLDAVLSGPESTITTAAAGPVHGLE
jgi:hypothetical protein